jgi:hypothetical protein
MQIRRHHGQKCYPHIVEKEADREDFGAMMHTIDPEQIIKELNEESG